MIVAIVWGVAGLVPTSVARVEPGLSHRRLKTSKLDQQQQCGRGGEPPDNEQPDRHRGSIPTY